MTIIKQTAKIVSAFVANNALPAGDIPGLIKSTHSALVNAATPAALVEERQPPAVAVKKSVTADAIICLECGKHQKMLKRHLDAAHGTTVEDYRAKWSLPSDYPMVAPAYAAHRSELALKIGLGRKKGDVEAKADEGKPHHSYPASRWSKPTQ